MYKASCAERLQLCLAISVSKLSYVLVKRVAYLTWTDSSNGRRALGKPNRLWCFNSEMDIFLCWHANMTPDHTRILLIFPGCDEESALFQKICFQSEFVRNSNGILISIILMQRNSRPHRVWEHGGFSLETAATQHYTEHFLPIGMSVQQKREFI